MSNLVSTFGLTRLLGDTFPGFMPGFGTLNEPRFDPRRPLMDPPRNEFPLLPWKLPRRDPFMDPLLFLKDGPRPTGGEGGEELVKLKSYCSYLCGKVNEHSV